MRLSQKISTMGTVQKVLVTGGVLVGGAAIVGAGAFAAFTSTGLASVTADAGQLQLDMTTQTFTIDAIAPGDSVYKLLPIVLPTTSGATNLVSELGIYLTSTKDDAGTVPDVTGEGKSLKVGADGLTYSILTCSVAWVPVVAPGPTDVPFTCATTPTVTSAGKKLGALEGASAIQKFLPSDFGITLAAGTSTFDTKTADLPLHSMIVFELPTAANNDYQNAAWTFNLTVAAIQRDATKS
jgi:hypothetical protein